MLNRIAAEVPRAVCVFAFACVMALLAACGAEDEPEPAAPGVIASSVIALEPATTPEELAFLSDVVARVRLLSASAGVRRYPPKARRGPAPVLAFRFRVIEYIKGSGNAEITVRVLAEDHNKSGGDQVTIHPSPSPTPDANAALRTAQARLTERDARWDGREAIVFLRPSLFSEESGDYVFTNRHWPGLNEYAITSDYDNSNAPNRAWLPGVAVASDSQTEDVATDSSILSEPRYFTSAPAVQPGSVIPNSDSPSASSISLSTLKAFIASHADMMAKGKDIPGYEECVNAKFYFDSLYEKYPPGTSSLERRITSGQPAGHRLWPIPQAGTPGIYYDRWWTAGPDADLFAHRITDNSDNDPATGYAWEHVTLRPIPKGEYNVFVNDQPSGWAPCGYIGEAGLNFRDMTITATAPDGVIHEAFFDPASLEGGAVGADASNGVLDPAGFAHDGAGVDIESIRWESGNVEVRLSPHTSLANHYADFIALDGTVSLRLGFADAAETGAGDSRALKWKICGQPWQDGDLLMLRISEESSGAPYTPGDADCAAATTAMATPETPAP